MFENRVHAPFSDLKKLTKHDIFMTKQDAGSIHYMSVKLLPDQQHTGTSPI